VAGFEDGNGGPAMGWSGQRLDDQHVVVGAFDDAHAAPVGISSPRLTARHSTVRPCTCISTAAVALAGGGMRR
jgi:hypothetical protein